MIKRDKTNRRWEFGMNDLVDLVAVMEDFIDVYHNIFLEYVF